METERIRGRDGRQNHLQSHQITIRDIHKTIHWVRLLSASVRQSERSIIISAHAQTPNNWYFSNTVFRLQSKTCIAWKESASESELLWKHIKSIVERNTLQLLGCLKNTEKEAQWAQSVSKYKTSANHEQITAQPYNCLCATSAWGKNSTSWLMLLSQILYLLFL